MTVEDREGPRFNRRGPFRACGDVLMRMLDRTTERLNPLRNTSKGDCVSIDQNLVLDTVRDLRTREVCATPERVAALLERVDVGAVQGALDELVARRQLEKSMTFPAWESFRMPSEPTVVAYWPPVD
jgi:hypothetical protein